MLHLLLTSCNVVVIFCPTTHILSSCSLEVLVLNVFICCLCSGVCLNGYTYFLFVQDEEGAGGAGDVGVAARTLDNSWHGAEAVHFFLLAQRQLLAGQIDAA